VPRSWTTGIRFPTRTPFGFFTATSKQVAESPSLISEWIEGSFPTVKCPEREADPSPLAHAEVTNAWITLASLAFTSSYFMKFRSNCVGCIIKIYMRIAKSV
jgi:hypothetical protein